MKNNYENKQCGECFNFKDECCEGNGWCTTWDKEKHCGEDTCFYFNED